MRVVFDSNTVVSALLFSSGRLSWLRKHWAEPAVTPLVSAATARELIRVLAYPKFRLVREEMDALLAEYLPFAEVVDVAVMTDSPRCRDVDDQMFVDLALQGRADVLVTGDAALLEMQIGIAIKTASEYAHSR